MSTESSAIQAAGATAAASPARVFWAAWLGWMLDGFDSAIYVFVLVPALSDLLRGQGTVPDKGHIALYGGYFFTVFMLGWTCSMFWGWLADRVGRVRVMCWTILLYSFGTALCGLAPNLLLFGLFRFLAGFGVGGEWAAGTPLLHESLPERIRVRVTGLLHTATPIGGLLAAGASFMIPVLGWRGMFFIGVFPALLTLWLRLRVPEPARTRAAVRRSPARSAGMFTGGNRRNTWSAALMMACIIFGLWSTTLWVPTLIVSRMTEAGAAASTAQRWASGSGLLMNAGTLIACASMPWIAVWTGSRRRAATIFFMGAFVTNVFAYAVLVLVLNRIGLFIAMLPVLGFFTNGVFALYTIWLAELFPTAHRAFGAGFAFSLGRLLAAVGPSIVGTAVMLTGSYPAAIAAVSIIYVIGLPFIRIASETAGKPLPA